jgi:hypothetical protein
MRAIHARPLAALFFLAACGGEVEDDDQGARGGSASAAAAEATAQTAAHGLVKPRPGQYRSSTQLLDFTTPGLPDPAKAQMRAAFEGGLAQGNEFCLTPQQADPRQMMQNLAESRCSFSRFDAAGSTLSADMACTGADGIGFTVTMAGQMTPDSATMTMDMKRTMENIGAMQMKMRVTSQRIGDCG